MPMWVPWIQLCAISNSTAPLGMKDVFHQLAEVADVLDGREDEADLAFQPPR
eukprot:CAMPEP_0113692420 /NCGR_PEP_ID=MMETSP0038_2-20120614/19070_1 /TAXON_ID=2898 /ORGANISM="Cryptomonas paramecium" /LENGTH=51 /DNA_ID=CAMNT_0000614321 /DNA_START=259 /DNA_END=414 /DNA_ORIENTATION=+ /assembly_acc=CAM_ASM_000170